MSVTLYPGIKRLHLFYTTRYDTIRTQDVRDDLLGVKVWYSTQQGFDHTLLTPIDFGVGSSITIDNLQTNTTYYVRYAFISKIDPNTFTVSSELTAKTYDELASVYGELTNSPHYLARSGGSNTPDWQYATGVFRVWNLSQEITGNGPVYSIVPNSATGGLQATINSVTGAFSATGWSGTVNSAKVTFKATFEGKEVLRDWTVVSGIGQDAPQLRLVLGPDNFVYRDATATLATTAQVRATAVLTNLTGTPTFTVKAYRSDNTEILSPTIQFSQTGNVITISNSQFHISNDIAYAVIRAELGGVYDEDTVFRLNNGTSTITVDVSNPVVQLQANNSGAVDPSEYLDSGTTIEVYEGAEKLFVDNSSPYANGSWTITNIAASGIVAEDQPVFGTYSITFPEHANMTQDTASIEYTIQYKTLTGFVGTRVVKQIFAKSKAGAQGDPGAPGAPGDPGPPGAPGDAGLAGIVQRIAYQLVSQTGGTPSYTATTSGGTSLPGGSWQATVPAATVGNVVWYIYGQYNPNGVTYQGIPANTTAWSAPIAASVFQDIRSDNWNGNSPPTGGTFGGTTGYYLNKAEGSIYVQQAYIKGTLIGATGTFNGQLSVGTNPAVSGSTMSGSGAVFNSNGTFAIGNSSTNINFNGTAINLNGQIVSSTNIATGAITAEKIDVAAVTTPKIAINAITTEKIADAAINTAKFASGLEPVSIVSSVPGTKSTNSIFNTTDGKLYRWNGSAYTAAVPSTDISGALADAQIASIAASKVTGQLSNTQIADLAATKITGQLTDAQLASISTAKLTGQIVGTQITDGAISTAKIAANAITANEIAAGSITTAKIATGAITANEIASGSITTAKIAAGAVTAGTIAADAITSAKIEAGAITTAKIAAGAVTAGTIAAGTITGDKIAANTITGSNIAADTITAGQIAAGAITASEIAAGAVSADKIAANTITAAQIAANTITAAEIAATTITGDKIAANTITAGKIQAGTITANEIAATTITGDKIAANTITAAKIQANTITGNEIFGTTLSAIKTNTGSLDVTGSITVGTSGSIRGGQSDFNTGTGWFLGYSGGAYKFSIGNSGGNNLTWNGSSLSIDGNITSSGVARFSGTNNQLVGRAVEGLANGGATGAEYGIFGRASTNSGIGVGVYGAAEGSGAVGVVAIASGSATVALRVQGRMEINNDNLVTNLNAEKLGGKTSGQYVQVATGTTNNNYIYFVNNNTAPADPNNRAVWIRLATNDGGYVYFPGYL